MITLSLIEVQYSSMEATNINNHYQQRQNLVVGRKIYQRYCNCKSLSQQKKESRMSAAICVKQQ